LKDSPPITLSWYDVRAQAPSKQSAIRQKINGCLGKEVLGPKDLLKGVSGIVKSGEMCAIMGASGAGKTTLLNILTHRRSGKLKISTDVRINGRKMKRDISGISAFVQQEELFIGSLTVREHLRFHAMLRLGREFTKDERDNRVDEVIHFLNLTKAENTTIGITGIVKGLSGGEKRRLTFATEILSDPPLLFCDEPTSGLDSSMAFSLVQAMRKLADQGKTIVCTIHQPSSEIFFLFDKLYLLAEGRLGYFGSLEKAPAFFRQFNMEIPRNYNPADFYIQKLAIYPKTREENLAQIERICDAYEKSPQNSRYMSEIISLHSSDEEDEENFFTRLFSRFNSSNEKESDPDNVDVQKKNKSRYATSSLTQFRWLVWRNFVDVLKNPFEIRLRIFLAIFLGTLIGLLYLRLSYDQTAIQNFNSLIFLIIINTSFSNIFAVVQSYTREYPIFYKEYDDAVYRVPPYYFAKFVTELPLFAITTLLQVTITYWMANLYGSAKRFFIFTGIIILTSFASIGLGSVISVIANSPEQAQALQIPFLLPLMIFGGFFLNNSSGQKWLNWIKYISWFYYANESSIINQWDDVNNLSCANGDPGIPCRRNTADILAVVGFHKSNFGRDIGLIAVIWFATRALSFFILFYKAKKHK
jgi:ABC-type multidrug transport system ATPase subunit/ABC-type multidrug transport system permease subunit